MDIKVAISGAAGRMGRLLLALADADRDFTVVQALERSGFPELGKTLGAAGVAVARAAGVVLSDALTAGADVLVDFSTPDSAARNARAAAEFKTRLVVGTTGLDDLQTAELRRAAERIPVLQAPNFSLGVNLLFRLAAEAARVLGDGYNVEIVEAHHNRKEDAPSGTALGIARAVADALGRDAKADLVLGRSGRPGRRGTREIGVHALRMGSVVGEHTAYFCNDHERVEIRHRAESRDVFAAGALRAAKWLMRQPAGMHSLQDMLFGRG